MFLAVSIWDFGFSSMMARDIAAGDSTVPSMFRSAVYLRTRLLPLALLTLTLGAFQLRSPSPQIFIVVGLFALAMLANSASLVFTSALTAELRFRTAAIFNVAGRLTLAGLTCLVYLARPANPLAWLTVAFLTAEVVGAITLSVPVKSDLSRSFVRQEFDSNVAPNSFLPVIRRSSPYAVTGFFILVSNRLDVWLVAVFAGATAAGFYAPASRIQDALFLFPLLVVTALTPVAASQLRNGDSRNSVLKLLGISAGSALLVSVPITILTIYLAHLIVPLAIGSEFEPSVAPLKILAVALPFVAIGAPVSSILTALGRPGLSAAMVAIGFVAAVIGMAILAPRWGEVGAAWASLAREAIIAVTGLVILYITERGRGRPKPQHGLTTSVQV